MLVTDSTISGNSAEGSGGGIRNFAGLVVTYSTITGNMSGFNGGGLSSSRTTASGIVRTMTVTGSTISGNTAAMRGGGISSAFTTTTIVSNTISGNSATLGAGGVFNFGEPSYAGTTTIRHSTITANTAPAGPASPATTTTTAKSTPQRYAFKGSKSAQRVEHYEMAGTDTIVLTPSEDSI
jgi:hypothetical protein